MFNVALGSLAFFALVSACSLFYVVNRESHSRFFVTRTLWLSMAATFGSCSAVLFLADPYIERFGIFGLGPTTRLVVAVFLLIGAVAVMAEGLFADRQKLNKYVDNIATRMRSPGDGNC